MMRADTTSPTCCIQAETCRSVTRTPRSARNRGRVANPRICLRSASTEGEYPLICHRLGRNLDTEEEAFRLNSRVRCVACRRLLLGGCASPGATPAHHGRLLLSALWLAAERAAASDLASLPARVGYAERGNAFL
jgi:hypothetical protein